MGGISELGLATVFVAGILSFLSPCVLPLVPGYVSYVAGTELEELRERRSARLRALFFGLFFVLGFSTVFVAFGASASWLGRTLLQWKEELTVAAGVLIALFGLHLLGLSPLGALGREFRLHLELPGGRPLGAYVMGTAFAFGWTPCIGPVLGAILTMTASTASLPQGVALLAVYSAGLGVPFLLAAWFVDALLRRMRRLTATGRRLQQVMGAAMVLVGIAMVTGLLQSFSFWLLETVPWFQLVG